MSDYEDDLAEAYEGGYIGGSGSGGGAAKKKKYKTKPTTTGKMRIGGAQAWGTTDATCRKGCLKKCCVKPL